MNSINRLDQTDLECYLNCIKAKKWDTNSGKNRIDNRNLKVIKEEGSYKFLGKNEILPLMLDPETLLDCINSFHKIIFQESLYHTEKYLNHYILRALILKKYQQQNFWKIH